jgi:ribonuclease HI
VKTRTDDMAKLGRDYHERVQQRTAEDGTEDDAKTTWTQQVLPQVPKAQKLQPEDAVKLEGLVDRDDIESALKRSKLLSSPGIDGVPFELWKELKAKFDHRALEGEAGFDIVLLLQKVYNDIQIYGVHEQSEFAKGWMQPIYKKKDISNIANYRPITLLNTDYKLFTKILSVKLTGVAHKLIHPDQAGFMPGRSIFDHIRLSQTMIDFAEVIKDADGYIIALDQEKAYDRIDHNYLWAVMRNMNVPESFIKTVESLYMHAHTSVAINGVLSEPFKVTRGVRQGDPLSCLLFNIAIEPLACMLRASKDLKGYQFPGTDVEKLIINLFADDAIVYLSKGDSYDVLRKLLKTWCQASGAKFNIEKTEILPIGKTAHRQQTIASRRIHLSDEPIPDEIHILKDGESFRSLGADLGNNIDEISKWNPHVARIQARFTTWAAKKPSMYAKKHIVQQVVFGATQLKVKAQGMPKVVEERINKAIRKFVWDDKSPTVNHETLCRPTSEGGLNLPELSARNEAIQVMWLKAYLTMTGKRPLWAHALDEVMRKTAPPSQSSDVELVNSFLQRWNIPEGSDRFKKLPNHAKSMLKVANKYGVNFNALRLSEDLQKDMPAWLHLGAMPRTYHAMKTACLKENHEVKTMRDLLVLASRHRTHNHWNDSRCGCHECMSDKARKCQRPWECSKHADEILAKIHENFNPTMSLYQDNLTHTTRRRDRFRKADTSKESVMFDPSVTSKDSLEEGFRIFARNTSTKLKPANRPKNTVGLNAVWAHLTAFTAGTCLNPSTAKAVAGAGAWIDDESRYNCTTRAPATVQQTPGAGELSAIIALLVKVENFKPITIITSSKYVVDGITKHLKSWEDRGYVGNKDRELWKALAYQLRIRSATVSFRYVKNGPRSDAGLRAGIKKAARAAKEGSAMRTPSDVPLEVPEKWTLEGAKTSSMTQKLATTAIREWKVVQPRRLTKERLDMAKDAIKHLNEREESDETIWDGIARSDTHSTTTRMFQWKMMHRAHRTGPHFEKMKEPWKGWGKCPEDGDTESIEHIMLECRAEGAGSTVWRLAKDLWPGKPEDWPSLSPGILYACGSLKTKSDAERGRTRTSQRTSPDDEDEEESEDAVDPRCAEPTAAQRQTGLSRLLNILVGESMYMIWLLRNERNIAGDRHSKQEIARRWRQRITARMTHDRNIARRNFPGKKQTKLIMKAKSTWNGTLNDEQSLPAHWVTPREFLVGIRPPKDLALRALLAKP